MTGRSDKVHLFAVDWLTDVGVSHVHFFCSFLLSQKREMLACV